MENEYIELVKKWRAGGAVSSQEHEANVNAALAAVEAADVAQRVAQVVFTTAYAARDAAHHHASASVRAASSLRTEADVAYVRDAAVRAADRAEGWLKRYEELTDDK